MEQNAADDNISCVENFRLNINKYFFQSIIHIRLIPKFQIMFYKFSTWEGDEARNTDN